MSLKETYKHLKDLLTQITADLDKGEAGNKAASQRVRTGTVKLEKVAKLYRKESITSEKKNKGQKKPAKTAAKKSSTTGTKKTTANTKPAAKPALKAKSKAKTSARPRA